MEQSQKTQSKKEPKGMVERVLNMGIIGHRFSEVGNKKNVCGCVYLGRRIQERRNKDGKTLKMIEKAIKKHNFVFLKYNVCVCKHAHNISIWTHTNILNEVIPLEVIMPSTIDFLNKTPKARRGKSLFE